jgi:hypothetical protein
MTFIYLHIIFLYLHDYKENKSSKFYFYGKTPIIIRDKGNHGQL